MEYSSFSQSVVDEFIEFDDKNVVKHVWFLDLFSWILAYQSTNH